MIESSTQLEYSLFLGYPLDLQLLSFIENIPSHLEELYFKDEQLKIVTYQGTRFIGKDFGESFALDELDQLISHILSLFGKLFPQFSFQPKSFTLFAINES